MHGQVHPIHKFLVLNNAESEVAQKFTTFISDNYPNAFKAEFITADQVDEHATAVARNKEAVAKLVFINDYSDKTSMATYREIALKYRSYFQNFGVFINSPEQDDPTRIDLTDGIFLKANTSDEELERHFRDLVQQIFKTEFVMGSQDPRFIDAAYNTCFVTVLSKAPRKIDNYHLVESLCNRVIQCWEYLDQDTRTYLSTMLTLQRENSEGKLVEVTADDNHVHLVGLNPQYFRNIMEQTESAQRQQPSSHEIPQQHVLL